MRYALLLLAVILFASGCTSLRAEGLTISVQADPATVYPGRLTTLHVDVDNNDVKSIENVLIEVFDTGLLVGDPCWARFPRMTPGEFQSLPRIIPGEPIACQFFAPAISAPTQTEVNARVQFDSTLSSRTVFELMREDEYQRRIDTGTLVQQPRSYAYRDRNVQIEVEFNDPPPLIAVPGKKHFVYFVFRNIGPGILKEIEPDELRIVGTGLLCAPSEVLYINGDSSPRIACEIAAIPDKPVIGGVVDVSLFYNYEIREKAHVNIVK